MCISGSNKPHSYGHENYAMQRDHITLSSVKKYGNPGESRGCMLSINSVLHSAQSHLSSTVGPKECMLSLSGYLLDQQDVETASMQV